MPLCNFFLTCQRLVVPTTFVKHFSNVAHLPLSTPMIEALKDMLKSEIHGDSLLSAS